MDVDGANQEADPSAATAGGTVPPAPAAPIPTPQQAAAPPSPAPAAARVPTPQSPQQQAPVPTPAPSTAPTGAPKAAEAKADGQGNRTSIGQGHDSDWLLDVTGSVPQIKVVNTATGNKRIPKKSLVRFEAVGPFGHSATRFYSSRFASTVVDVAKNKRIMTMKEMIEDYNINTVHGYKSFPQGKSPGKLELDGLPWYLTDLSENCQRHH
ncbi:unnamed protein product [Symbiodinium natans]|uniref:Uncharacterized protein n=1 Tax=Symbiodinium natans TaxID=878477 RepID=A0A812UWH9_9DINO|nr:unnamed protein product [Symbiodinium natans]